MPIYSFKLRDGSGTLEDENGVELADDNSATQYGHDVAHELMKSRELETRSWCLDVYEEGGGRIGEIPFARVDPTLDHLTPKWRTAVEGIAERKRLLGDVISAVDATVQESRALVARAASRTSRAGSADGSSATFDRSIRTFERSVGNPLGKCGTCHPFGV
jgi:hypothetical protein